MMETYKNDNETDNNGWNLLNVIQKKFDCCGYNSYSDWFSSNDTFLILPCACSDEDIKINENFCNMTLSEMGNKTGCEATIKEWINLNILAIVGVGVLLIIIEIFQFSLAFTLLRNIQRMRRVEHI
ncbi:tetraspanin-19 [Protopterus annectens]|uniref:tetraspanin-19 n=1 Tax=Protopterus annectens TaxID=7888 RepID=UPI001CFB68A8|nr:tetraspanin-19 [Protopterus annectens]